VDPAEYNRNLLARLDQERERLENEDEVALGPLATRPAAGHAVTGTGSTC